MSLTGTIYFGGPVNPGLLIGNHTAALETSFAVDGFTDATNGFVGAFATSTFPGIERFAAASDASKAGGAGGSDGIGGGDDSGSGNSNGGIGRPTQFPLLDLCVLTDEDRMNIRRSVLQFLGIISDASSPFHDIATSVPSENIRRVVGALAIKWFRLVSNERLMHQDQDNLDVMPLDWFYDELEAHLSDIHAYRDVIWNTEASELLGHVTAEAGDQVLQLVFEEWGARPHTGNEGQHDTIPSPMWAIARIRKHLAGESPAEEEKEERNTIKRDGKVL